MQCLSINVVVFIAYLLCILGIRYIMFFLYGSDISVTYCMYVAKSAKHCDVGGQIYKDGQLFELNCSLQCTCQNGQYACASSCPQEERPPSRAHCREAQLVSIKGRCCREWVCPYSHSLPRPEDETSNNQRTSASSWVTVSSELCDESLCHQSLCRESLCHESLCQESVCCMSLSH